MKKTLDDWLQHFENLHSVGIDMGLARVSAVWKNIRKQEDLTDIAKHKVITVAGTNGKGSTCQMLALLLSSQSYRVGMYTSPHIHHFQERIQIDGRMASHSLLIRAFEVIEIVRNDISLSYFEATTLAGLLIFAWEQVDFAILEVGLGGRLDAVNIIDADTVIITSISHDHLAYLGSDLTKIAVEKMGVCRPQTPTIYAELGIADRALQYAKEHDIPLYVNGRDYKIVSNQLIFNQTQLQIPETIYALGTHQTSNCAGVLISLSILKLLPNNYAQVLANFSLTGRLQKIAESPAIIIDVAHNEDAAKALAQYLHQQDQHYNKIYAVIGMLKDKDHKAIFPLFQSLFAGIFLGSTEGERGMSSNDLATIALQSLSCPITTHDKLETALKSAKKQAKSEDLIIAFGSFCVAETLLKKEDI